MVKTFFLLLIITQSLLFGHQTGLSYITINELETDQIDILYKKPLSDTRGGDINIRYPKECIKPQQHSYKIENGFILRRYKLDCEKYGLMHSRIWVEGLLLKDRGLLISYTKEDFKLTALLRAATPFLHITKKSSRFEFFKEYVILGVAHIWSGYDHLLFVLSLILLATSTKKLLWSITGFTFAHSITLAFGILGIINVGVSYIEAMIALSILFLAKELFLKKMTFTKQYLGVVAFIFGLLHGFGFSNVLRTIGLPQEEIPLSLFAFNLGIELGQVLFIFFILFLLFLVKRYIALNLQKVKITLAYFIGITSSFWLIERVMAF